MAKSWLFTFGRRTSTLALIALLPLGLTGLAAAAPVASEGAQQQPVNLLQLLSAPASGSAGPLIALPTVTEPAVTEHVGIVPSALRPIPEYRTAAVPVVAAGSANPAALPGPLAQLAPGPLGIPGIIMHAYQHAADLMATVQPVCALPWNLLAGIGKVESGHASGGRADINGNTTTRILGPVLDGHLPGNAVITDSDGGALDGDAAFDRAVGPMQFMPGTWSTFGADGNNDGIVDPNNVYDAAFAAGRLLCSAGINLSDIGQTAAAILRYNHSAAYVQNVQSWAIGYGTGAYPTESDLPPIGEGEKSIDAQPDLTPAPTPDVLPPPEDTPAPTVDDVKHIDIAPGISIPIPELPCFIDCPAPPA
ncbi:lytic transglycosylase domain-containing protein [Tomitella biformata]|uniref:lytic transglycosylase domain-containing protein n=1 Tax=Tomitella biformata TaxID=630403 RepID=UPI0004B676D7|nr:lytic transglycosylase [Tomitella biformata]